MRSILLTSYVICIAAIGLMAQGIVLDESVNDWTINELISRDEGDALALDINNLYVANDDKNIFFRFSVDQEMLIQQDNDILLYLDIDNDSNTGNPYLNIGADLIFNFAKRQGNLITNQSSSIFHSDIGLITSPTVSSKTFEISILRTFDFNNINLSDTVAFHLTTGGLFTDNIPNENEANIYIMKENVAPNYSDYKLLKTGNEDFRILSYNVLRDNIFEPNTSNAYSSLLTNINADIMCFQEIYDYNSDDVINKLESINVINNPDQWYGAKDGNDLITVSKYPIIFHKEINGNSLVVINKDGQEIIIFNCHLPCCDNDDGREDEIDDILRYIRSSLEGNSDYPILLGTPYMILGDMNFVGFSSQVNSLLNGDIFDNAQNGPDFELDWDKAGLTDLKPQTTGSSSLFTWYNPQGSYSAGRLDYIFYTDAVLESINSYVLNTALLSNSELQNSGFNFSDTGIASDHLPLVADYKILRTNTMFLNHKNDITVYPNPAQEFIHVDSEIKINSYQILSQTGKIVTYNSENCTNLIVDISNFTSGIYYIIFSTQNGYQSMQFVVE